MSSFTGTVRGTSALRLPPDGRTIVTAISEAIASVLVCSVISLPPFWRHPEPPRLWLGTGSVEGCLDLLQTHPWLGLAGHWLAQFDAFRTQQFAPVDRERLGMFEAVGAAPARRLRIPGERRGGRIVVVVLVLDHLAQHQHQTVERTAGRPPGGVDADRAVEVMDVGVPDRGQPFQAGPALWILAVQVDLDLMVLAELGSPPSVHADDPFAAEGHQK